MKSCYNKLKYSTCALCSFGNPARGRNISNSFPEPDSVQDPAPGASVPVRTGPTEDPVRQAEDIIILIKEKEP